MNKVVTEKWLRERLETQHQNPKTILHRKASHPLRQLKLGNKSLESLPYCPKTEYKAGRLMEI